jgi:hypothetical protein
VLADEPTKAVARCSGKLFDPLAQKLMLAQKFSDSVTNVVEDSRKKTLKITGENRIYDGVRDNPEVLSPLANWLRPVVDGGKPLESVPNPLSATIVPARRLKSKSLPVLAAGVPVPEFGGVYDP